MRLRFALLASLVIGCSGEAETDSDPMRTDARSDSATTSDSDEDTGTATDDTGTSAETSRDAITETSADVSEDTRPMCPGSEAEPNNSIPSAVLLKEIDDCDGSGSTFKGVVAGGSDPDFFHYKGNDKLGCVVDATASTKTTGVRLCVFVACSAGTTERKSCKKGMAETAPGGVLGCCTSGPGEVVVEHGCPLVGTSDTADVYMRVDAPGSGSMCTGYEVAYHF